MITGKFHFAGNFVFTGVIMKHNLIAKKYLILMLAGICMISSSACSSSAGGKNSEDSASGEITADLTTDDSYDEGNSSEDVILTDAETTETPVTEETEAEMTEAETAAAEVTSKYPAADPNDPDLTMFTDPDIRSIARWYLDQGYHVEPMTSEDAVDFYGEGTEVAEGFVAGTDSDGLFTLDHVLKFSDRDKANAFLDDLNDSDWAPVVSTENPDGSLTISVAEGFGNATLSNNNVLVLVF